jgi:rod shape-determining protein MreB and related proteins
MRMLDILRPPLVGIDVGTAMTRICWGSADLVEQPSVVREDVRGTAVVRRVMRGGVVADIAGVASVIGTLLDRRGQTWRRRPAAVVFTPTDVSVQERDALVEAVIAGGASVAAVVPEPLAAAIGAGVDLASEYAAAVVDIGDGVTDFAAFTNGAPVFADAIRIGCGTLRAAIHDWLELQQMPPVTISDEMVETVVRAYCRPDFGSVALARLPPASPLHYDRDDLEALLDPVIDAIASFVAATLRNLPDTLAAEVIESGIHITGGGANLARLVERIEARAGLPAHRARDPLTAVIRGAREMLRNPRLFAAISPTPA